MEEDIFVVGCVSRSPNRVESTMESRLMAVTIPVPPTRPHPSTLLSEGVGGKPAAVQTAPRSPIEPTSGQVDGSLSPPPAPTPFRWACHCMCLRRSTIPVTISTFTLMCNDPRTSSHGIWLMGLLGWF